MEKRGEASDRRLGGCGGSVKVLTCASNSRFCILVSDVFFVRQSVFGAVGRRSLPVRGLLRPPAFFS